MNSYHYLDDILILAPTRWKLKRAIRVLNETFDELNLEKHPDKTAMGRTEKGFDFLGFHFSPEGLSMAEKTIENFISHAIRLYEQEQREPSGSHLLGVYVQRWERWRRSHKGAVDSPRSCEDRIGRAALTGAVVAQWWPAGVRRIGPPACRIGVVVRVLATNRIPSEMIRGGARVPSAFLSSRPGGRRPACLPCT